nr:SCP2 sterol-binding domain-containing protein [Anaerolineae bacterium]
MPATVKELFAELPEQFDASAWGGGDAVLAFNISGDQGGQWVARIAGEELNIVEGTADDVDMTMSCSDEDLLAMVNGELNAVSAFMQGKLKIDGNMSLAMKLQSLLGA